MPRRDCIGTRLPVASIRLRSEIVQALFIHRAKMSGTRLAARNYTAYALRRCSSFGGHNFTDPWYNQ